MMEVKEDIVRCARELLMGAVSEDYADDVLDCIADDVVADVMENSGVSMGEGFSYSDVRYSIGRTLLDKINKEEL